MDEKVKIRSKLLKIRESLEGEDRALKNERIAERLEELDAFKKAHHILFYYSVRGEVDTLELIERTIDDKQLYLPIVRGKSNFQAVPIMNPLNLKKSFEGVPEPADTEPSDVYDNQIEMVIVPGVAFDKKGNRIGMGKGYYDRYLNRSNAPLKVALAYEEQILDYVPKDPYDECIDMIVTDQNIYQCNK